ncbi:14480_t:CDS:2 [Entrophospora sp. SA101]|nr:14480_t:CDS:2 [Entrophospora sp. SA101]
MSTIFPPELLTEIFERLYLEEDKPTLFSCCLVDKGWHKYCIKLLWREPFESKGSVKILINCLKHYSEPGTLLREDDVQLDFELLGAGQIRPLYNYAAFARRLAIFEGYSELVKGENISKDLQRLHANLLIKNLVNLMLKSAKIQEIYLGDLIPYLPNNFHENRELHFENIREFHYVNTDSPGLLNNFVGIANEIKKISVEIKKPDEAGDGFGELINRQSKLRIMHLIVEKDCSLFRTTLEVLLGKSGLLTEFKGYIHTMDEMLKEGAEFTNMKKLNLFNHYDDENNSMSYFKHAEFPSLEEFHFQFNAEGDIDDFIQFISQNGSNLKVIVIEGNPDEISLELFIEKITITCRNLKLGVVVVEDDSDNSDDADYINIDVNSGVLLDSYSGGGDWQLAIFEGYSELVKGENISKDLKRLHANLLIKNLVNLILKSAKIKEIYLDYLTIPYLPNNFHKNSGLHFKNIKILHYNYDNTDSPGLLNNFVGIANKIEKLSVEIKKSDEAGDGLGELISQQSELKIMHLLVEQDCSLFRTTLEALLGKSGSLIEFRGYIHTMDEMLKEGAEFTNMKKLYLFNHYDDGNISMTSFKDAKFPQLEEFHFQFNAEGDIDDLIQFIGRNGSNLKVIVIEGNPDENSLELFIEKITITCRNLKYLYLPTSYHQNNKYDGLLNKLIDLLKEPLNISLKIVKELDDQLNSEY